MLVISMKKKEEEHTYNQDDKRTVISTESPSPIGASGSGVPRRFLIFPGFKAGRLKTHVYTGEAETLT